MPTIRDVVQTLSNRDGVDTVVLLSRDGLTIDAQASNGIDPDGLAALVPGVISACNRLGSAADRGALGTCVVEFERGMLLVAEITSDALLAMVFRPDTNIGSLLFELQRHRSAIAGLL